MAGRNGGEASFDCIVGMHDGIERFEPSGCRIAIA